MDRKEPQEVVPWHQNIPAALWGMFGTGIIALLSTVFLGWRTMAVFDERLGAVQRDVASINTLLQRHQDSYERHVSAFHSHEKSLSHNGMMRAFEEQQRLLIGMDSQIKEIRREVKNGN